MDNVPTWEAHGTSYGFSSIGIPITHPGLDSFNQAIAVWVDEKIQSKSNMDVLADYGVDMDHPCVRVYAKEEVDTNRKFLVASAESFTMHEFPKVCSFGSFCNHLSPHVFHAERVSGEHTKRQGENPSDGKARWQSGDRPPVPGKTKARCGETER